MGKNRKNRPNGGRGPWMIDASLLYAAGIDPKTLLPLKITANAVDVKNMLQIIDEQNAINSFVWYNVPGGLTGQDIERMLYYKGQLCFFRMNGKFYFMPYALSGTIDFYGRYNSVKPVPWSYGLDDDGKKVEYNDLDERSKAQYNLLSSKILTCVYDVLPEFPENVDDLCVLLSDYTKQYSQTTIPRSLIQKGIIQLEADIMPFARTALLASVGTRAVRVQNSEESANVIAVSSQIYEAAMTGKLLIPAQGTTDFQDLANAPSGKPEDFLEVMQAVDNFRVSAHGIDNGGLFQKKAHKLESEQKMNAGPQSTVLQDRLRLRQNFCNIVNSIVPLGMWCEPAEEVTKGADNAPEEQEGGNQPDQGGKSDV